MLPVTNGPRLCPICNKAMGRQKINYYCYSEEEQSCSSLKLSTLAFKKLYISILSSQEERGCVCSRLSTMYKNMAIDPDNGEKPIITTSLVLFNLP